MNNGIKCSYFSLDAPVVGELTVTACLLMDCRTTQCCIELELLMELVEVIEMHGF